MQERRESEEKEIKENPLFGAEPNIDINYPSLEIFYEELTKEEQFYLELNPAMI